MFFLCVSACTLSAQNETVVFTDEIIRDEPLEHELADDHPVVDKMWALAAFPGSNGDWSGEKGLNKWIQENLVYPQGAERNNIEGIVDVRFVIERNGVVSNVKIAKGAHPLLDNEALIIKNMPKWRPGRVGGTVYNEDRTISIEFKKGEHPSLKEYMTYISASPYYPYESHPKLIKGYLKYPEDAKISKTEGTVEVGFIVRKDGTLYDVKIVRGVCKSIDEEALRLVKSTPIGEWNNAIAHGQPIAEYHILKIEFKLPE